MKILVLGAKRIDKVSNALDAAGLDYVLIKYIGFKKINIFMLTLIREIKNKNFDYVICDVLFLVGIISYFAARANGSKFIIRLRGDAIHEIDTRIFESKRQNKIVQLLIFKIEKYIAYKLIAKSSALIMVSNYLKKIYESKMQGSKIYVCPTPVLLKKRYNYKQLNYKKMKLLTISNFSYYDKAKSIIDLMQKVDDYKNINNNFEYIWDIIGGGKYLNYVINESNKYNSPIYFHGYKAHVENFYKNADIFLYFSYLDAYPSVILEAQDFGLPILSNKGFGMDDQIKDGINGYLIEINNSNDFLKKFNILVENKSKREYMGSKGKSFIISNNNCMIVGKKFIDILKNI